MNYLIIILMAYLLDLIFGDPQWRWHPVRLMGRLIAILEKRLNTGGINKKLSGLILVILVVSITFFSIGCILRLAELLHHIIYFIVSVLLIYFALSIKSLGTEANEVHKALNKGNLVEARRALSMIVARDTGRLEKVEIIRATVETVAESIMDGIISPLFYAFLGGSLLAWVYKSINTLDSMIGYRSQQYIDFGMFAAKIDGLMNFIPAKITCIIIFISSFCYKKYYLFSGKWALKYFLKPPQYNSEATEAVMAGALGIQLGGLNFYNSLPIQKNLIGDNIYPPQIKHIKDSIKIAYISSALFMLVGLSLIWLMERG